MHDIFYQAALRNGLIEFLYTFLQSGLDFVKVGEERAGKC